MERPQPAALATQWHAAWQEHAGWLLTVLRARVHDETVADELLQAVGVTAWTRREQLCDNTKIGPWLYRIALRQVQMFWRSQGRQRRRFVPLPIDTAQELPDDRNSDPLIWLAQQEIHQHVRDALEKLSAQDREILMLKHSEQWTYRQIAEFVGISNDKVIHRLARARSRLRQRLLAVKNDWEL